MLSGARPGQHETKRSGEYSIVTTGADYSAINTEKATRLDAELLAGIDPDQLKVAEEVLDKIKANILKAAAK